jgi:hypothetical protein
MADEDMNFGDIAERLGRRPSDIRDWFNGMIDGTVNDLDAASDFALALGREIIFGARESELPTQEVDENDRARG